METIFKYNPTVSELKELFCFDTETNRMAYGFSIVPMSVEDYDRLTSNEEKLLDLAKLFEFRSDQAQANKYWSKIPDIERQYRCGFDFYFQEI